MNTDLFLAMLNRSNARGHPILSALVYCFCPTAARWWLAGADPLLPYDPVWSSLQDLTSGGTLMDYLKKAGLDGLGPQVREYVEQVRIHRSNHPMIPSPENTSFFDGTNFENGNHYGFQNAIEKMGGDWRSLTAYVRTWAFLVHDWRGGMKMQAGTGVELSAQKVALILPFTRLPVQFDSWVWRAGEDTRIGLLVSKLEQWPLLFSLMAKCSPSGSRPWPNRPAIHALDRDSGEVGLEFTSRSSGFRRRRREHSNSAAAPGAWGRIIP